MSRSCLMSRRASDTLAQVPYTKLEVHKTLITNYSSLIISVHSSILPASASILSFPDHLSSATYQQQYSRVEYS